jgi:hypothetical protein
MTKIERIRQLFSDNIWVIFESSRLHETFGSSFRSRVSDINNNPDNGIKIVNHHTQSGESWYWAEPVE